MPVMKAELRLCLNGKVVPSENVNLPLLDPFNIAPADLNDEEPCPVTLVPIKRQGPDVAWLCSALEVKQSWWITHMTQIPLFVEILEAIKSKKVSTGAGARMPRQPRSLVPLKIRGRVVWFANSSRSVGLALVQGLEIQQLEWFMDELLHDIEEMQDQEEGPGPGPVSQACKKHALDKTLQDLVDESVKTLQEHHKCQSAYYLASRNEMKVMRKGDKAMKFYRLKNLKRKLNEAQVQDNQDHLQNMFDIGVAKCLNFLEGKEDPEDATPADEPGVASSAAVSAAPSGPIAASRSTSLSAPGAKQS